MSGNCNVPEAILCLRPAFLVEHKAVLCVASYYTLNRFQIMQVKIFH